MDPRAQQTGVDTGIDFTEQQVNERLFRLGELVGKDAMQPPPRRHHEPGRLTATTLAVEHVNDGGDVKVQPLDGTIQLAGGLGPARAGVGHRVGDHRQQQLVLAGEVAVERLQRNAGLFDQFLGREGIALDSDEPQGRVEHRPHLVGDAGARPLDGR